MKNVFQSFKNKPRQNGTNKSFTKQPVKKCEHNVFTAEKRSEV